MARLDLLQSFMEFVNEYLYKRDTTSEDEFYDSFHSAFMERFANSEVGIKAKELITKSEESKEGGELIISCKKVENRMRMYPVMVSEATIHSHVLHRYLKQNELYMGDFSSGNVYDTDSKGVLKLSDEQVIIIEYLGSYLANKGSDSAVFIGFYLYCIGLPASNFFPYGDYVVLDP
ncbi:MAG: hypothetical protein MJ155_01090 [Candidatus Saccharibacteria bacterium]|nr:hypothetical protein [Candidatus Saccharibacteria bacterium]